MSENLESGEASPERIRPIKLAHFVLRTARPKEMVDWYQKVLEADVVFRSPQIAFLTYDDEHHRIAIAHMPGLLDRPGFMACVEHIAFTYASLGDLAATYRRLSGLGIEPTWCINHGPTTSMYFTDPDGNHIELQVDNFPDAEQLAAFFRESDFAENPIGVDFDPGEFCDRVEAGESHEELVRWKPTGPRGADSIPEAYLGRVHSLLARVAAGLGVGR